MDRELTFLERGIFVTITHDEMIRYLANASHGFLPRSAYPQKYEDIAETNEIGRHLFFRFLEEE